MTLAYRVTMKLSKVLYLPFFFSTAEQGSQETFSITDRAAKVIGFVISNQETNPCYFFKCGQKYSRQLPYKLQAPEWTLMLHKQFRGADRGGRISKRGPKGENWFQVHVQVWLPDGEIAFLYAAAAAVSLKMDLGFKDRSKSFGAFSYLLPISGLVSSPHKAPFLYGHHDKKESLSTFGVWPSFRLPLRFQCF